MKFVLMSDLHVDFWPSNPTWPFKIDWTVYRGQIVVVAGDISNYLDDFRSVLGKLAAVAGHVIVVDGNHEHYRHAMTVHQGMDAMRQICRDWDNVTYLDGASSYVTDGTAFVGACGWYDFAMSAYDEATCRQVWAENMNDVNIDFAGDPADLAIQQTYDIMATLEDLQEREDVTQFVLVTHMVPHPKGLFARNNRVWDALNGAFGCMALTRIWRRSWKKPIAAWCFGHTHFPSDFIENGIRFVCNPRGYPGERRSSYTGIVIDTDGSASAFGDIQ